MYHIFLTASSYHCNIALTTSRSMCPNINLDISEKRSTFTMEVFSFSFFLHVNILIKTVRMMDSQLGEKLIDLFVSLFNMY